VISLEGVGHEWGAGSPWARRALSGISLQVQQGDRVVVVGRNGSGKSTLAWILGGVLQPSEGLAVHVPGGEPLVGSTRVAIAFQHARLQALRATVWEDIRLAAASDDDAERAMVAVGLDPLRDGGRAIDHLSGGQLRRSVLAALLARDPEALVLDEPFAGLDRAGREHLLALLQRLTCAVVVITHDMGLVPVIGGRRIELEAGRVVSDAAA
jgi:energy-coupling factor transport system ATP-binding protein